MSFPSHFISGIFIILLTSSPLHAIEIRSFDDPAKQQRYEGLIEKLRCLVCQNQSLADSDADLAKDLRTEVYEKIQADESEADTLAFLTDRYGDFVLYDPPLKGITLLLWCGPLILFTAGALLAFRHFRKHRLSSSPEDQAQWDRERLEALRQQLAKSREEETP